MRRFLIAATLLAAALCSAPPPICGQSVSDLNLQFHGYVTQALLYSNQNSWDTTGSENVSAAWTEGVFNVTSQPSSRLRIGAQARYFLLGNYGNKITMDWIQGDYQVNDHFGFRAGKVKSPIGLLNETQDIDPAQLWVLLPQSIYSISNRDAILSHNGGVVYGSLPLGESFGKLEYRGYGGERILPGSDGYLQPYRDEGITFPSGLRSPVFGGTLKWEAPLHGLVVGASADSEHPTGAVNYLIFSGTLESRRFTQPYFFARYEHDKVMIAGEYNRLAAPPTLVFTGLPSIPNRTDQRNYYVMGSYRIRDKLTAGLYFSSDDDHQAALGPSRYEKDWALSARYDFTPYLYAKFEQHFIDGTGISFSTSDNPNLQPTTRLTVAKLGFSF